MKRKTPKGAEDIQKPYSRRGRIIAACVCCTLAAAGYVIVSWYVENFDTSLAGLLFSIAIPQKGTGPMAVTEPAKRIALIILWYVAVYLLLMFLTQSAWLWGAVQRRICKDKAKTAARWEKAA